DKVLFQDSFWKHAVCIILAKKPGIAGILLLTRNAYLWCHGDKIDPGKAANQSLRHLPKCALAWLYCNNCFFHAEGTGIPFRIFRKQALDAFRHDCSF
ncbi:MAG: hypothetical protein EBX50_22500, partial [Chitinophagia bacterium]|nr:hypothetical protein [Chitinophagia bacterium]